MKLFLWGFELKSGLQVHVLEANKRPTRVFALGDLHKDSALLEALLWLK